MSNVAEKLWKSLVILHILTMGSNDPTHSNYGKGKKNEDLYNILPITAQTTDSDSCCRRSKKTECPTNYTLKEVDGEERCYPYCSQAAKYAGYGTNSKPSDTAKTCSETPTIVGGTSTVGDWEDIPSFYDPYKL